MGWSKWRSSFPRCRLAPVAAASEATRTSAVGWRPGAPWKAASLPGLSFEESLPVMLATRRPASSRARCKASTASMRWRTILLTTHYIEEAERLCDRVAIIDEGRIIEIGTPREIQQRTLGHSLIELRTLAPLPAEVPAFADAEKTVISE